MGEREIPGSSAMLILLAQFCTVGLQKRYEMSVSLCRCPRPLNGALLLDRSSCISYTGLRSSAGQGIRLPLSLISELHVLRTIQARESACSQGFRHD
jgi:hypothetical protein